MYMLYLLALALSNVNYQPCNYFRPPTFIERLALAHAQASQQVVYGPGAPRPLMRLSNLDKQPWMPRAYADAKNKTWGFCSPIEYIGKYLIKAPSWQVFTSNNTLKTLTQSSSVKRRFNTYPPHMLSNTGCTSYLEYSNNYVWANCSGGDVSDCLYNNAHLWAVGMDGKPLGTPRYPEMSFPLMCQNIKIPNVEQQWQYIDFDWPYDKYRCTYNDLQPGNAFAVKPTGNETAFMTCFQNGGFQNLNSTKTGDFVQCLVEMTACPPSSGGGGGGGGGNTSVGVVLLIILLTIMLLLCGCNALNKKRIADTLTIGKLSMDTSDSPPGL